MRSETGASLRIASGVALLALAVARQGGPTGSPTGLLLTVAGIGLIASGAVSCIPLYNAMGVD